MRSPRGREAAGAIAVFAAAALLRFLFLKSFPSIPVSNFRSLVDFAVAFTHSAVARGAEWAQFNPGMPMALSFFLRLFPTDPAATARWATVLVLSATAVLPLIIILRPVVCLRRRVIVGLALAA